MLYLEDYLEMIEHLPQELRDRFTEMREMDLSVQNIMDSLEKRIRLLFNQCRRGEVQGQSADVEFNAIRNNYYKVLEDADEKVQLGSQMFDLVERYLRRLDSELYKFKCELEADHNGITEILEKRSLELDGVSNSNTTSNQKENRYFGVLSGGSQSQRDRSYRHKPEKRRDSSGNSGNPEKRQAISSSGVGGLNTPTSVRPTTPNLHQILPNTPNQSVAYSLQHMGAASVVSAAASQAIAATQQLQQGRRTASLKASYEAIHGTTGSGGLGIVTADLFGRELAGATHNAIQAVEREGTTTFSSNQRRQKKKFNSTNSSGSQSQSSQSSLMNSSTTATASQIIQSQPIEPPSSLVVNDSGIVVEQSTEGEWTYDPNEPRYCICNQVSYGDMVACDNEDCPNEWFHYPCVGITQSPKGKWFCPQCTASMRRRARKN